LFSCINRSISRCSIVAMVGFIYRLAAETLDYFMSA